MTNYQKYGKRPYILRKKYADDTYLEIIDIRLRNKRIECLSRWTEFNPDGSFNCSFGYRWRKICGKGIFVPSLDRPAKDYHSCSLTIHIPITGKMIRAYLRDFKEE